MCVIFAFSFLVCRLCFKRSAARYGLRPFTDKLRFIEGIIFGGNLSFHMFTESLDRIRYFHELVLSPEFWPTFHRRQRPLFILMQLENVFSMYIFFYPKLSLMHIRNLSAGLSGKYLEIHGKTDK